MAAKYEETEEVEVKSEEAGAMKSVEECIYRQYHVGNDLIKSKSENGKPIKYFYIFDPKKEVEAKVEVEPEIRFIMNKLKIVQTTDNKNILNCLMVLIENQIASQYFKYNVSKYCNVILTIIRNINDSTQFENFLKRNIFNRSVIDEENYINLLLIPLIKTSNKFDNQEIFDELSIITKNFVFNENFNRWLDEIFENDKFEFFPPIINFLLTLKQDRKETAYAYRLIFSSFCKSNRKNFEVIYKMLVLVLKMTGFQVEQFKSNAVKPSDSFSIRKALKILSEVSQVVEKTATISDYKLNGDDFNEFVKNLIKSIIHATKHPNNACYDILLNLISFNPIVIESVIDDIIVYVMLNDNNNGALQEKYEAFLIGIFQMFDKMRRIQNLISKMIRTLKLHLFEDKEENANEIIATFPFNGKIDLIGKSPNEYEIKLILPEAILELFTTCISSMQSWQVINLMKTLLFHLREAIKDIDYIVIDQRKKNYLQILCTLTYRFVGSVRIAENTSSSTALQKFVVSLEELGGILRDFGSALLNIEYDLNLMSCFLNISYNWAEIYMAITYYSISAKIELNKTIDNNYSSCNITYLHSYLSIEQWCLISERVSNFGGTSCKEMMNRLLIQKLRAMALFENEVKDEIILPIIKSVCLNMEDNSLALLNDNFFLNNIVHKMPPSSIICLADNIFQKIINCDYDCDVLKKLEETYNSNILTEAMLRIVFKKINNSLKQKRKHNDDFIRKTLTSKLHSILPEDILVCHDENIEIYLRDAVDIFVSEKTQGRFDLKINDGKLDKYMNVLKKLPIVFCSENVQMLVVLFLFSLHKDLNNSNCDGCLGENCETLLIDLIRCGNVSLINIFESNKLIHMITNDFVKYNELFSCVMESYFKNQASLEKFQPGIDHLKEMLSKNDKYLKCSVIFLNYINKAFKKSKLSPEMKKVCSEYRSAICKEIVNVITKSQPEVKMVLPYTFALKAFLLADENDNLAKLTELLDSYLKFTLSSNSSENFKDNLTLYTTILHNKFLFSKVDDNFVLQVWNTCKNVEVINKNEVFDEYSQMIDLIFGIVPNDKFQQITNDLLDLLLKSFEENSFENYTKHLKTCSAILSCNFNPAKTKILQNLFENVLEKNIIIIKGGHYQELNSEIINFNVKLIQTNQFSLTSNMINLILLSVTLLLSRDFEESYNSTMTILNSLLKYQKPLIMDRLPAYLQQYRLLLRELCARSSSDLNLNQSQLQKVSDNARQLEKLTKNLASSTKDMTRISVYLIADILDQYEQITFYPSVKIHLNNCLYNLISLCDQHAVSYLMRVLSNASTEIFKIMYENYKKYYRFTGKV